MYTLVYKISIIIVVFNRCLVLFDLIGEGVQTRRQTDSQTTRVGHGHKPGGRSAPTSHRPNRRWSDQWPRPRRAQRQHTHAHVRPFFIDALCVVKNYLMNLWYQVS